MIGARFFHNIAHAILFPNSYNEEKLVATDSSDNAGAKANTDAYADIVGDDDAENNCNKLPSDGCDFFHHLTTVINNLIRMTLKR